MKLSISKIALFTLLTSMAQAANHHPTTRSLRGVQPSEARSLSSHTLPPFGVTTYLAFPNGGDDTFQPFSYLAYDETRSQIVLKRDAGSDGSTQWQLEAYPYEGTATTYDDLFAIRHVPTNKCLVPSGTLQPQMELELQDCESPRGSGSIFYSEPSSFRRQYWSLPQDDGDNTDNIARVGNVNLRGFLTPDVSCDWSGKFPQDVGVVTNAQESNCGPDRANPYGDMQMVRFFDQSAVDLIWGEDAYNFDGRHTLQTVTMTSPYPLNNVDVSLLTGGKTIVVETAKTSCDAEKCYFATTVLRNDEAALEAVTTVTLTKTADGLIPVSIDSDDTSGQLLVQLLSATAYIQEDAANDQLLFKTPDAGATVDGVTYISTVSASA